jgi:hypothetical protein
MSKENVEIVRRAISHLNETGEPEWGLYDPELVWTTRPDGPAHFTYRGLEGLRRGTGSMRAVWARITGEIEENIASGDRPLAASRQERRRT